MTDLLHKQIERKKLLIKNRPQILKVALFSLNRLIPNSQPKTDDTKKQDVVVQQK